jgi:hypothetical protein
VHLERLFINSPDPRLSGELSFAFGSEAIRKWTLLPTENTPLERLHHVVVACATRHDAPELQSLFARDRARPEQPTTLEAVLVSHAPRERSTWRPPRQLCGWVISRQGAIDPLEVAGSRVECVPFKAPPLGRSYAGWLMLAYGTRLQPDPSADCLEFVMNSRRRRYASLLGPAEKLTSPVAFLEQLHYRGMTSGRPRSRHVLATLNRELAPWFNAAPEDWLSLQHDFNRDWEAVPREHQPLLLMVLDSTRHLLEFAGHSYCFWNLPGVVVMNRPEAWCPPEALPDFFRLLDRLIPSLQFVLRIGATARRAFPEELGKCALPVPEPQPRPQPSRRKSVPRDSVLLIDVDAPMPNLALMKLSRFHKEQGRQVILSRISRELPEVDTVMASCIFHTPASMRRIEALRRRFGDRLHLGGSGVDLQTRLPPHIESLEADFSLYPALGDRAIGFLTRGCPRRCPFCVVPLKEGKPRLVSNLESLLQGRRKLILLDDNLLAHPQADELLDQMAAANLAVNFNQTLDLRLLTQRRANLLRRIHCSNAVFTRRCYHFSLNDTRGMETLRERLKVLSLCPEDNVEFVCMYGFRTTLAEDLARFQFLRSLPRSYVFVQRYQPPPGGPEPDLARFFDDRAEANLDALVKVVFPQNMKSMEVYYRWVCVLYARHRGRIHEALMDTLFRYNARHRRGAFTAKLQALCNEFCQNGQV